MANHMEKFPAWFHAKWNRPLALIVVRTINISWRAKIFIAQLTTNSHQLGCETRRSKSPKEVLEERVGIASLCIVSNNTDMKPAQEKIEKIDQRLRIQPLRGGNLLYIT